MTNESTSARAKQPRSIAAGPYGHPFHPVLVTVPIGAWTSSLLFDVIALFSDEESVFAEGAYWLVGIGIVGAVAAALVGALDYVQIPKGTKAHRTAVTHMVLNLAVIALFLVSFLVRGTQGYEEFSGIGLALSLVGLATLGASGWLGGKLAYHYGVRVADEATQAEGFR